MRIWDPSESTVEQAPNSLEVAHDQPGLMSYPHWHAQVEVNFVMRGAVSYRMFEHTLLLEQGSLALFWGGLPHQVVDASADSEFVAIHLPLVHFFRLRLPDLIRHRIMHGATLVTSVSDSGDFCSFDRWCTYMRSGVSAKVDHAIDDLLLRIERIPFEPFDLLDSSGDPRPSARHSSQLPFARVRHIVDFIADNFQQDIDSLAIALSAGIHPKYAMGLFRKSTGMTLNEYVTLLRLSFAQAQLINGDGNVLSVAMESGFRSLSAFNKSFRKISGKSPSDFRRVYRSLHRLPH